MYEWGIGGYLLCDGKPVDPDFDVNEDRMLTLGGDYRPYRIEMAPYPNLDTEIGSGKS